MRLRSADGIGLHAEVTGAAEAPVTVVLAHGWTLDSRCWEPVADSLAGLGSPARIVRYDHRGHGRSDTADPSTLTIEQLADDLAAVIAQVAPAGPLVLGGHSMGGMTAMALAERHPELVRERLAGVALVATASGGLADATFGLSPVALEVFRRGERRMYASRGWDTRRALSTHPWLLGPGMRWLLLGSDADRRAVRLTTQVVAECRPSTVSGFRPTLEAHERDAALAAFAQLPVEIMVGSKDRLTPPSFARRIREGLPGASLTVFPEAGHMLPVERVAGVSARLHALSRTAAATHMAGEPPSRQDLA
ncbi:MAG: alpha/beta hydrolase [Pseudonocardia sp.]|nr:alpha/beta hydrolase [Pseudonocardia sp.]